MTWLRRAIPYALLPLSLIACALASAPWLRAFPASVVGVPLFGAAVLSVLTPLVVVGVGVRPLWLSALIDVVIFVFFELIVTLRAPGGFGDLYDGLAHGPSQILTFALPLVSPRTLMVAPVALCWLSGSLLGECLARGWHTALPYVTLLVTFGLSYAATARAVTSAADGQRYDTLLAALLLFALLLLRAAQAWVMQDESAETTQADGTLPLRSLAIGAAVAVVVTGAAAGLVQAPGFAGRPVTPARVPPLAQSQPLTPISFVSSLRPNDPRTTGVALFAVSTDRPTTNYVALASVDYYDGESWTFNRTFRPSGGVLPADTDPAMRPAGPPVTQQYTIDRGALTTAPWLPYLYRPQRITGVQVNIDATSGMIVAARDLRAGDSYAVRSLVTTRNFDTLSRSALLGTSAAQVDTSLASGLAAPLGTLITSLEQETGTSSSQVIPFLQAVAADFRTRSSLAGAPASSSATASAHPFVKPSGSLHPATSHSSTAPAGPTPTPTPTPSVHAGGTTFADVLASIRVSHSATPEQYATLMTLIARQLGVPARVVTGFRIPLPSGASTLPAGSYQVTSGDAWTWVEIPIRGLGWVVLDPSPSTYAGRPDQSPGGAVASPSPSPTPSQSALLTQSNNGHAVAPKSRVSSGSGPSAPALFGIVVGAVLVALALLVVALLGRKRLRARRRQRLPDPRHRLLGAWQESLDVLAESGLHEPSALTSAEVAARAGARFGADSEAQARELGEAANAAIFSPSTWVGPAEADAAWRTHAALTRSVRGTLDWRQRVAAELRYHSPRRRSTRGGPASWSAELRRRRHAKH